MAAMEQPFYDPKHRKQLLLSKKTFNRVSAALFNQLRKIFPADPKLQFLHEELNRMASSAKTEHVPAMQFFSAMNIPTGVPSIAGQGNVAVVGELILNSDDRLFSDDCSADIPQLNAVDFKAKWGLLNDTNRTCVWGYLQRMAELSAKVAAVIAINPSDIIKLVDAASKVSPIDQKMPTAGMSSGTKSKTKCEDATAPPTTAFNPNDDMVERVLQDPEVAAIAAGIAERVKKMSKSGSAEDV